MSAITSYFIIFAATSSYAQLKWRRRDIFAVAANDEPSHDDLLTFRYAFLAGFSQQQIAFIFAAYRRYHHYLRLYELTCHQNIGVWLPRYLLLR